MKTRPMLGELAGETMPSRDGSATWNGLVIAAVLVNATFETMLLPALPLVKADLAVSPAAIGLVYAAYPLAAAISLPVAGKLGDIFGPRRLIVSILALLTLGALLPALLHSLPALIAGQSLQGVGTALVPLGIALLGEARTGPTGVRSGGLIMAAAVSTAAGLLLAGALLGQIGYRPLFWFAFALNAALSLAAVLMLWRTRGGRGRGGGAVDWLGALLLGAALTLLLMTISSGGDGRLGVVRAGGMAGVSLALLALFVLRSTSTAEPLVDIGLLKVPAFSRVALIQLFSGFGASATLVLVPLLVQNAHLSSDAGQSAARGGFALAPFGVCSIFAPLLVARLRARFGVGPVMLAGAIAVIVGPILLLAARDVPTIAVATGALGFGIGLLITQSFDLIGTMAPIERIASLSSLMFVLKMIGSAVGSQIALGLMGATPSHRDFEIALTVATCALLGCNIAAFGVLRLKAA